MMREILIIGGGVIGLSIARTLRKKGVRKITLLEKAVCGREASWAAAGMLGPQAEANSKGDFFDLTIASRDLYPAFSSDLYDETGIDIELDCTGTLYFAFSDADVEELAERLDWQTKTGLPVEHLSAVDARKAEPFVSPDVREALFFPNDWQVENRKLLTALRRYADLNGIEIIENTEVARLIVENGRVCGAETGTGVVNADATVIATGAWTSFIKLGHANLPVKVEPVRGQIVTFRTAKRLFAHVAYTRRGYIVPRFDGRILAGSTSELVGFDRSISETAKTSLCRTAVEIFPGIASLEVSDQWSGLRPVAGDAMPIIGSIAGIDGLIFATAHYRNGILLAPLTAEMVADKLVDGIVPQAFTTFGPDRFRFAAGSTR
ncbi:MAG: glycine oxidase ThiO [Pyrinomonadaceae bacterium]